MKKVLFYIIIFSFLCSLCNERINYTLGKKMESPYFLSFASIGANSLEFRVDAWAIIDKAYSLIELQAEMTKILEALDLPTDNIAASARTDALSYRFTKDNIGYTVSLLSDPKTNRTAYVMEIETNDSFNRLFQIVERIEQTGLPFTSNYCLSGCIDSIVEHDSQKELIKVMLKTLEANIIEEFDDGRVTSVTAYSKSAEKTVKPIKAEGTKYNVQIAVHPDLASGKTCIMLGLPMLLDNY
ncbi:MAG: YwmB family TATA-box binding protein [Syntrophomonadaceae bacterium]